MHESLVFNNSDLPDLIELKKINISYEKGKIKN
jgi:hypothetical protein